MTIPPKNETSLTTLFNEMYALYTRFGLTPTAPVTLRVWEEENRELKDAAMYESAERVAHEAIDVIWTAIGVAAANGVTPELLEQAAAEVIHKNGNKTPVTYTLAPDGKIRRIVSQ